MHISDIHIRTGDKHKCRYDEYMFVFEQLACQLRAWQAEGKHLIVVITGDIFHHKSKIESAGIVLFHEMLSLLENLAHVVLICGNHDYCQESIEDDPIDMIQAMLHNRPRPNVTYLNETRAHKIGNIVFGLVAIQDVLQKGSATATIQNPTLPAFPHPMGEFDVSVALFHGMLNGCTLQNYSQSPVGVPLNWFDGYDIVMLGDVHLRQNKKNWGYAGSLIQQNFGEPPFQHGGLLWDIQTKQARSFNIKSNISYATLRSIDDARAIFCNEFCPQHVKLRTLDPSLEESILDLACALGKTADISTSQRTMDHSGFDAAATTDNLSSITSLNPKDAFDDYIDMITPKELSYSVRQWTSNPSDLCIPSYENMPLALQQASQQRNKKIDEQCVDYTDEMTTSMHHKMPCVELQSLEWDWILCFKSGCKFDFQCTKDSMVAINARNGQGKSSFIDIICISLFGTSIHHMRNYASSVICMQTPAKANAKTVIRFKLSKGATECYELMRTFTKVANNPKRLSSKATLKLGSNVLHSGKTAVDKWVAANIGSMESFVFSSVLTQQCTESFFNLDNNQQVELLDTCLYTNLQNKLHAVFKTAHLAHMYIAESLDILKKQESTSIRALESTCTADKEIIIEYETLQKDVVELASAIPVDVRKEIPSKPISLLREELMELNTNQCVSTEKLDTLMERLGKGSVLEARGTSLEELESQLVDVERAIEALEADAPAPPPPNINEAQEIVALSPPIEISTLEEMRSALAEAMSTIPKDLQHFVTSDIEPEASDFFEVERDELHEPHNPDCWACNARSKSRDKQTLLSLIKHCRNTSNIVKQQEAIFEHRLATEALIKYNQIQNSIRYGEWKKRIDALLKQKVDIESRIRFLCNMFTDRESRICTLKYWICSRRLKDIEKDYKEGCGKLFSLEQSKGKLEQFKQIQEVLQARISSIERAQNAISGYRVWLFKNRIIPRLTARVNSLMKMVTSPDHPLELYAKVHCEVGSKLAIEWFVQNGPQRPPVEKASGFQKFIVGLAIRIALTQLGSGTRCSHLFLDEGFVACDAAHLSKIPVFLSNLLFLYDSIIVCTHLEDLKDAMDMHVFIQRDASQQLSFLDNTPRPRASAQSST